MAKLTSCAVCGTATSPAAIICPDCGTDLTGPTAPAGHAPATVLDQPAAPATVLDTPGGTYSRVNLPPPLRAELRIIRDLGFGAQADVVLAERIGSAEQGGSGERVVVKLHRGSEPDERVLRAVAEARFGHVIRLLGWDRFERVWWEILEFAADGPLDALIADDPPPWPAPRVRQLLDQLASALTDLHSVNVVHRDLKPQNVLVRDRAAFDLAVADFGLSRVLEHTRELRSTSRTPAYAAPEAVGGAVSPAMDWWSLGVMLVEVLTGTHPFRAPGGGWISDRQIDVDLMTRPIDLSGVTDERWHRLCAGLTVRDPSRRWGAAQVAAWQRGASPDVAVDEATAPEAPGYRFAGRTLRDPRALAAAFAADWPAARRVVAGRDDRSPSFAALASWLRERGLDDAEAALRSDGPIDTVLARLLARLDPGLTAGFRGREVTRGGLAALVDAARDDVGGDLGGLLRELLDQGILAGYDGLVGCEGHRDLQRHWADAVAAFERATSAAPPEADLTADRMLVDIARVHLLDAALSPARAAALARRSAERAASGPARRQAWFRTWSNASAPRGPAAAHHVLTLLLAEVAERQTADERRRKIAGRRDQRREVVRSRVRWARWLAARAFVDRLPRVLLALPAVLVLLYGATFAGVTIRVLADAGPSADEVATGVAAGWMISRYQAVWAPTLVVAAVLALALFGRWRGTARVLAVGVGVAAAFRPRADPPVVVQFVVDVLAEPLIETNTRWEDLIALGLVAGVVGAAVAVAVVNAILNRTRVSPRARPPRHG